MDLPAPMLPTAGRLPLGAPGWGWEIKWDGIRVITGVDRGQWQMVTRNGNDIAGRFPELAGILDLGDIILDGELVVLDADGPNFGATISRLHTRRRPHVQDATVFVFDILRRGREDLRRRPYTDRRAILEALEFDGERWAVPPVFDDGASTVAASQELGFEGVVAKRLTSPYVSGRSRHWVKARHANALDMTVVGWVRRASGGVSLLLAEPTAEGLAYRGRVTAPRGVVADLAPIEVPSAAVPVPAQTGDVHWVQPDLQVEVTASSREPDGRLRQPRFRRLRLDL